MSRNERKEGRISRKNIKDERTEGRISRKDIKDGRKKVRKGGRKGG